MKAQYDELVSEIDEAESQRDEARDIARRAVRTANRLRKERDAAMSLQRKHLVFAEKKIVERDEAQRDHAVTLERIANLAFEAALTDGAHHKQWYLEKIMAECGAPVQRWHKAHKWQVGIAP